MPSETSSDLGWPESRHHNMDAAAQHRGPTLEGITREWREYVSGGCSAVIAVLVTFPINKAMFRQQVHNIHTRDAMRQLHMEGALHLYRGVMSPLIMKVVTQSIMFGSYTQYSRLLSENLGLTRSKSNNFGAILAGGSEALLMPLERVQVLMQDKMNNARYKNTVHAFVVLRHHGFREYYRGLSAILLRNCPGNIIFFSSREKLKDSLPKDVRNARGAAVAADFVGGACLGAFISSVFFPVNVTKAHMQLVVGGKFLRFRTVFRQLLRERGVKGMFRGVHVNYTRSFLSWGIVNVTYEKILALLRTV